MRFQPIVYFCILSGPEGVEPVFGRYQSEMDNDFSSLYSFSDLTGVYDEFIAVWYDLETRAFYRYALDLKEYGVINQIFFIAITQGGACVWIPQGNSTRTFYEPVCEVVDIVDLSDEWQRNRNKIQSAYDRRPGISDESGIFKDSVRRLMRRYVYRYHIMVGGEKPIDLKKIDTMRFDGSIHRLSDSGCFDFTVAARPMKSALSWSIDDDDYTLFVWFDEKESANLFGRLYGMHPDTRSDLIVSIDAERRKYGFSLYRQGMKEPLVIPRSACQLIVFKNRFEDYRSENYNQPHGAWVW